MSDYNRNRRYNDKDEQRLLELERETMEIRSNRRFRCDHSPRKGAPVLNAITPDKLSDLNYDPRKLAMNGDDVVYCKDCGATFELAEYTKEDFDRSAFQMRSAFEQMKTLVNLNDEEYDEIVKIIGVIENLRKVGWRYYDRCMLSKFGGNKKVQTKKNQKGTINLQGTLNRR